MQSFVLTLKNSGRKQLILVFTYLVVAYALIIVSFLAIQGIIGMSVAVVGLLALLFLLWFVVLNFTLFLQEHRLNIICFVAIFALLSVLFLRYVEVLVGLCVSALGYWTMLHRARGDRTLFTRFSAIRSLRHCVPWCVVGLSFLISITLVSHIFIGESTQENPIPRPFFNTLFAPVEEALGFALSEYESTLTSQEVRDLFIQQFVSEEWIDEHLSFLQDQQTAQSFKDAVYEFLNDSVRTPLISLSGFVSVFTGIALFFLFQLLLVLLMFVSFFITFVVIKLFIRYGIILVEQEQSTQQRIQFTP